MHVLCLFFHFPSSILIKQMFLSTELLIFLLLVYLDYDIIGDDLVSSADDTYFAFYLCVYCVG